MSWHGDVSSAMIQCRCTLHRGQYEHIILPPRRRQARIRVCIGNGSLYSKDERPQMALFHSATMTTTADNGSECLDTMAPLAQRATATSPKRRIVGERPLVDESFRRSCTRTCSFHSSESPQQMAHRPFRWLGLHLSPFSPCFLPLSGAVCLASFPMLVAIERMIAV